MKSINIFYTISLFVLLSKPLNGQVCYKIWYNQDSFFTFNTSSFLDSTFKKPFSVPDGKWVILSKDSLPIYFFNTQKNCIHGEYSEYWDGVLKTKGYYRMDSIWSFRFNRFDERFKDSTWILYVSFILDTTTNKIVGFQDAVTMTYNSYYPNGSKKLERRGQQIEINYYENGLMKSMITNYKNDKDNITVEQNFDSIGQLIKIITIRTTTKTRHKVLIGGIFVSSDTVEYNGFWKKKEIIENNKQKITILYGEVGQEISRIVQKKKKSQYYI